MVKIKTIIIIVLLSILLISCAITPKIELDNFVTDLDVINRYEEIAFDIEFGRWSKTFQKNIEVLIDDLESYEGTDEKSISIVAKFIKSAKAFLSASDYYYNNYDDEGDMLYNYAVIKYKEALSDYNIFIQE